MSISFSERLSYVRDATLAAGGILYALGYTLWSLYAWRYHLGPVPALRAQYFVAGIVFAIIIVGSGAIAYAIAELALRAWPRYLESRVSGTRDRLLLAFVVLLVMCIGYGIYLAASEREVIGQAVTLLGVTLLPFLFAALPATMHGSRKLLRIVVYVYFGVLAIAFIGKWVERWYPALPQELGGAKPRIAYIDVRRSDIEGGVLAALCRRGPLPETQIVSTQPVHVLVRSNESLLVSLPEIPTSAVVSITWIEER